MASKEPFMQRHHFLLRRLHSFTGVFPIGVFLIVHLTTNASIVWGRLGVATEKSHGGVATFQHEVEFIHSLPALLLIEIFGLWLPIAFHSILGVYYATTGKSNIKHYRYQDNWRYTMQRISGYIGVLFIFYHVATLRWGWTWLPFASGFNFREASSTTAIALRGGSEEIGFGAVVIGLFYLVGVLMLVFHFANGLWTAAITWGVTITEQAQRRWGYVCAGLGFGLAGLALAALVGFVTLDIDEAREYERARIIELESAAAPDQQAGQLENALARH
ncbi:MAG: succinate dehydrogenase [Phycisphaeraceae bacterium]|nr:MAG: succinate dehydrogenase [Phycisphaeraceae bacterium]